MRSFAAIAAFAAGANALVGRGNTCCFHLDASGGASGTVGQLGDGQNRLGGGLPVAKFCIDSSGSITSNNSGCILTRKLLNYPNASPERRENIGIEMGLLKKTNFSGSSPYHSIPM